MTKFNTQVNAAHKAVRTELNTAATTHEAIAKAEKKYPADERTWNFVKAEFGTACLV